MNEILINFKIQFVVAKASLFRRRRPPLCEPLAPVVSHTVLILQIFLVSESPPTLVPAPAHFVA